MEEVVFSTSQDIVSELLQCTVCMEVCASPIQTCCNGHLTCGLCKERVLHCPLCRETLSLSPFAERIVRREDFIVACRNVGCMETTRSTKLVDHMATCVYGPMRLVSPGGPVSTTLILDNNPGSLPYYSTRVDLPSKNSEFKVTVKGNLLEDAYQFAIDILESENLVFHMNPRLSQNRTVFNAFHERRGWGQEEYRFFESLVPEDEFEISIVYCKDRFTVTVNNELASRFSFKRRFPFESTGKEIRVCKANRAGRRDVVLQHVQLDVFGENNGN